MEKHRKFKILSIVALLFAVVGLSVGFAAFQKIMNISSSAEISLPSDENLNIKIYGLLDVKEIENIFLGKGVDLEKWSTDKSIVSKKDGGLVSEYYATIDNENLTIDINDLPIKFGEECGSVFLIENNSQFGVYLNFSDSSNIISLGGGSYRLKGNCKSNMDVNQTLMDAVCDDIYLNFYVLDFDEKLERKGLRLMSATIEYDKTNNNYVDGEVIVEFPQIKISFDTVSDN